MKLSKKINNILPSNTVVLGQKARELISLGKDIIQLGEGEPDFNTPDHIINAALDAMNKGKTKYTNVAGTQELRKVIKKYFEDEYQLSYQEDQIVVGNGGKQLIFNALLASIDPGEEVIIPSPYWVSYPQMVNFADGTPILVTCPSNSNFKITPKLLKNHINKKTIWLILNSPGNPTGSVYSEKELIDLAKVLRDYPYINVICDDIYSKIIYDNESFVTLAQVAPDLKDRVLTVNGLSKSYAMTGWRIGYAAGNRSLINAMIKLQGQSTTNASSISQAAAVAALSGSKKFLDDWIQKYHHRRNLTFDILNRNFPKFKIKPKGAFYHFINCDCFLGKIYNSEKKINDDIDFCKYLLEYFGVSVVPGSSFGCSGYFRLCYAKSETDLKKACERINKFVSLIK
jgi:aspartate aminotransferase